VNWFLSLAAIFVVKDGESTFDAVRASLELLRREPREYMATASWFGFFRSLALVTAIVLSLFAAAAPNGAAAAVIVAAVALGYFAVVDWMYVARLAAFVQLAEPPVVPARLESSAPSAPAVEEPQTPSEWRPA
jgi:ABC-type transport system involved in cytochrome bd biosynthesis fused ATPase/permease subunit